VGAGQRYNPPQERVRCIVLHQVVGQNSCRLIAANPTEAACSQVSDNPVKRRFFTDKATITGPCDQINVHIYLYNAGTRRKGTPRFDL